MSKKKVLLVNANLSKVPYAVAPVGLCLIAESIKPDYMVRIFDGAFRNTVSLIKEIEAFKPDYIGISIRNVDDYSASEAEKRAGTSYFVPLIYQSFITPIRTTFKGIIILGGAGFSIFPSELLELFEADFGIIGEGEEAFPLLLNSLDAGITKPKISGCICKHDVSVQKCPTDNYSLDVNFSNVDKWVDYSHYGAKSAYPIQTKRGCPHRCIYCSYPLIEGNRYRLRNAIDVVDEIESVAARLEKNFELVDSVFNDPPGHAENICEEIIRRNLKVKLRTMGVNPGGITDNLIKLMREAGFGQIDCTPDSASPKMIKNYGKNFTFDQLFRSAEILRQNNLPVMWFFILGGPGETAETLHETCDFIENNIHDLDLVSLFEGLRIYPGTPLYTLAINEGYVNRDQSLLKPFFYNSKMTGNGIQQEILAERKKTHANWITATESRPDPDLIKQATDLRALNKTDEPMFRSLLKVKWMKMGKDYRLC
jgi:radical SAM superfamily enzyme YgiQ (UPF0313 family)